MKKYSEVMSSQENGTISQNAFKDVQRGFPLGPSNIVVVGQTNDFGFNDAQGVRQNIGMVKVVVLDPSVNELTPDTPCSEANVVQASLAGAIGCYSAEEWAAARDEKTIFRISAERRTPVTAQEITRGKGKLIITKRA